MGTCEVNCEDVLYIVIPAYNEEQNIRSVVEQWYPVLENGSIDSRIVIADKGSSDRTHDILEKLIENGYDRLELLDNEYKQHGPKVIALYKYAIDKGADYIFQTDSDGQTNPDEFFEFWNNRKEYDVILGNRADRKDGKDRAFVEFVVCLLLKIIFGVKVPDANAPFRLMKSSVVAKYINRFSDDFNIPNIVLTAFFANYGEKMLFRKISFKPRQAGINSINIPRIIAIGWKALGDFYRFKKNM